LNEITNNGNLLVIGQSYNAFEKETSDILSTYFEDVEVLVRYNPIAGLGNIFPIGSLERFRKCNLISKDTPVNLHVRGTPTWYLPLDRSYKGLGERHYQATKKVLKGNRKHFDIIHSHFLWSSGYVGAKLKADLMIPLIVTAHGFDIYELPFKDEDWRGKIEGVLNSADHIITVSQSNLRCINKLDVSTPATVIPNAFKEELFHPRNPTDCRKALGIPMDKKIILSVGMLETVKGHKYLIDAIKSIISQRNDIVCVIIGTGKLQGALEHQIHTLGLEEHVRLEGGKPHEEIPLWMNASDIFVLPSLDESFGVVLIESMACGTPVIGTNVGGISEIITSSSHGFLAKSADASSLADAILKGLETEWSREAIVQNAKKYEWKSVSQQIIKLFQQMSRPK
jgi:glycosyltransferase involved in cell wall biosynthesis